MPPTVPAPRLQARFHPVRRSKDAERCARHPGLTVLGFSWRPALI